MKSFKLISNTSDVRILASGKTTQELFSASLEALCAVLMMSYAAYWRTSADTEVAIELASTDETALLVEFLSDALRLMHTNKTVYNRVEFESLSPNKLVGKLVGYPIAAFRRDVKAVTYREAGIQPEGDSGYKGTIVLDL